MKTARFADVVKKCGKPESHLILLDPSKDRELQQAIKAKRVMTVFQDTVGTKADRGIVGFEAGSARQFLIFPKSLRDFAGRQIVGIKYDLWTVKEVPKSERARPAKPPPKKRKEKEAKQPSNIFAFPGLEEPEPATLKSAPAKSPRKEKPAKPARASVPTKPAQRSSREARKSPPDEAKRNGTEKREIETIKAAVRKAMKALEAGKQVAAFNLLKKIVES